MAKTYNTFTNVATGDVYTAASHNAILQNLAGYRVPPMCIVSTDTNVAITTATETALAFQSASTPNTDMTLTAGTSSSTLANGGKVTVTTAGVYLVTFSILFASNATGVRGAAVIKNGTGTWFAGTSALQDNSAANSGGAQMVKGSGLLSLAANDYLQLTVYQTSGGNLNAATASPAGNLLTIAWLGQAS
jgi:hypothetical protein